MLVILALLCAGCAPAASSGSRPPASAGPSAEAASAVQADIGRAEDEMYANAYAAADGDFLRLLTAAPRSAAAAAAYALFLNYRGDESLAQAEATKAVALDPHSAMAEAVLCRVHDWAGDVGDAVTAGRSAIALDSSEPLGHLFLSEALADAGDIAGSQAQIAAAQQLITPDSSGFLRSELLRETANLDSDSGRPQEQIAALQQSLGQQPGWLYRVQELAHAQSAAEEVTAARQTLDAAAESLPADVDALEDLGAEAMVDGDGPVALAAWQKAATLAPGDPTVLDMQGEVQVAVNRDTNAAVQAFEHALTANPDDLDAAAYLTGLARFVQGQPGLAATEITAALQPDAAAHARRRLVRPNPEAASAGAAAQALAVVNATRAQAGLPAVQLDPHLTDSAMSHAFYWLFNNASPSVAGLGIHQESQGLPGFSGTGPGQRAIAWGYSTDRTAEDITHRGTPTAGVDDWVNSVFHRFPILRPDLVAIGYGQAEVGSINMQDMEFGYSSPGSAAPVRYPAAAQTKVPDTFVDNELPDPVPAGAPRTTGYPVTVTFAAGDSVSLTSFTLSGPDGAALTAYLLAPSSSTENSASLLPAAPLRPATTYAAHIVASVNGQPYDQSWSFTTAG
ncbi:MAG: hypothetical protein JOZ75_00205 [Candidatus Dormibacteraeota bacterium]|nr:hypothetical protein [Candidatus Dormibacteraeota bacterium]